MKRRSSRFTFRNTVSNRINFLISGKILFKLVASDVSNFRLNATSLVFENGFSMYCHDRHVIPEAPSWGRWPAQYLLTFRVISWAFSSAKRSYRIFSTLISRPNVLSTWAIVSMSVIITSLLTKIFCRFFSVGAWILNVFRLNRRSNTSDARLKNKRFVRAALMRFNKSRFSKISKRQSSSSFGEIDTMERFEGT